MTLLGSWARQLCLWCLGTTHVRSLETRQHLHSLAPHGEQTVTTQRCYCFRELMSGDKRRAQKQQGLFFLACQYINIPTDILHTCLVSLLSPSLSLSLYCIVCWEKLNWFPLSVWLFDGTSLPWGGQGERKGASPETAMSPSCPARALCPYGRGRVAPHLTISVNTVNKHTLSCTRPPGTHRANREFNTGWSDILWTEGNTTKKEKKKRRGWVFE